MGAQQKDVEDAPIVRKGFVVKYGHEMPVVLHDGNWSVQVIVRYLRTAVTSTALPDVALSGADVTSTSLPDGYRIALASGVAVPEEPPESVWLFGTVAESAHRFPDARITVVDPPEFCPLPSNAMRRD